MAKMKIKTGDTVQVLSGKDKDKRGVVVRALPREGKVVVEGVAVAKKAVRPTQDNQQGGFVNKEMPIDVSNVALIDPKTDKPTRVATASRRTAPRCASPRRAARSFPTPTRSRKRDFWSFAYWTPAGFGSRAFLLAYLHKNAGQRR